GANSCHVGETQFSRPLLLLQFLQLAAVFAVHVANLAARFDREWLLWIAPPLRAAAQRSRERHPALAKQRLELGDHLVAQIGALFVAFPPEVAALLPGIIPGARVVGFNRQQTVAVFAAHLHHNDVANGLLRTTDGSQIGDELLRIGAGDEAPGL